MKDNRVRLERNNQRFEKQQQYTHLNTNSHRTPTRDTAAPALMADRNHGIDEEETCGEQTLK